MRMAVPGRGVAAVAPFVDVRVGVLYALVAMGMDMEVPLAPPKQKSEGQKA